MCDHIYLKNFIDTLPSIDDKSDAISINEVATPSDDDNMTSDDDTSWVETSFNSAPASPDPRGSTPDVNSLIIQGFDGMHVISKNYSEDTKVYGNFHQLYYADRMLTNEGQWSICIQKIDNIILIVLP